MPEGWGLYLFVVSSKDSYRNMLFFYKLILVRVSIFRNNVKGLVERVISPHYYVVSIPHCYTNSGNLGKR